MTGSEPCDVSYHEFPIAGSPFDCDSPPRISENDVADYCNRMIGDEIGHSIMTFSPRQSATVIALRSAKPNTLLMGVYRNLKDAASKQLSGTKAGIICVQFRNVTAVQLRDVAASPAQSGKPSGIQSMTAKFFDSVARNHVHTVAYVAPGNFISSVSRKLDTLGVIQTTSVGEDASSYFFTNKAHPQFADPRYNAFGQK